jgi:hypothetical protein
MGRGELERLSKEELIELVLRLPRPEKTSRTSSKPPSTDRKAVYLGQGHQAGRRHWGWCESRLAHRKTIGQLRLRGRRA